MTFGFNLPPFPYASKEKEKKRKGKTKEPLTGYVYYFG